MATVLLLWVSLTWFCPASPYPLRDPWSMFCAKADVMDN